MASVAGSSRRRGRWRAGGVSREGPPRRRRGPRSLRDVGMSAGI
jgi:hypothetical protein